MESKPITLSVDADLAMLYEQASPEIHRKAQILFEVLLREMISPNVTPLNELMDTISDKAQERGLTPEILDDILSGGDETGDFRQ